MTSKNKKYNDDRNISHFEIMGVCMYDVSSFATQNHANYKGVFVMLPQYFYPQIHVNFNGVFYEYISHTKTTPISKGYVAI